MISPAAERPGHRHGPRPLTVTRSNDVAAHFRRTDRFGRRADPPPTPCPSPTAAGRPRRRGLPAESRDPALGPGGPPHTRRVEGDAVVLLPVQHLPGLPVVEGGVTPGRPDGHPPVLRPGDPGPVGER